MQTSVFSRLASILALGVVLSSVTSVSAQQYGSYLNGKKTYYTPGTSRIVIKAANALAFMKLGNSLSSLGIKSMHEVAALPGVVIVDVSPNKTPSDISQLITALKSHAEVTQATPVFVTPDGKPLGSVTDEVIVQLKSTTTPTQLQQFLKQTGANLKKQYEFDKNTYYLTIDKSKGDAMTLANTLFETGLFDFAEPNFIYFATIDTNDPLYPNQ